MVLDELVLHNFGVYGGRQSVTLTPTHPNRPIILFGGLNGGGKTTLLDALQLCLFGNAARCSNRNGLAYNDYLTKCIHRDADSREAAIELVFRHTVDGEEQQYRIHRSWKVTDSGCRERFHVLRDGQMDKLATEHWAEHVEEFIPARIAHLFLFDGEKIEGYAELDSAPALIATAVQNLLGLDIVERLATDLSVLERRKRSESSTPAQSKEDDELRDRIESLSRSRQQLLRDKSSATNVLDRRERELAAIEERFRREGGSIFEQRTDLERSAAAHEQQLAAAQRELRELAADSAPLLLVPDLVSSIVVRDRDEEAARRNRDTSAAIAEEYEAILALPALGEVPQPLRRKIQSTLRNRLEQRASQAARPICLDLHPEARSLLASLISSELDLTNEQLKSAVEREQHASASLAHVQSLLASSPTYDVIADVSAARDVAHAEIARLRHEQDAREQELVRCDRELAQLREREARMAEARAREEFASDDTRRILAHSAKVRDTLTKFREAVVERHVARIEKLVLESFHQLIRKRDLIGGIRIDPKTFALDIRDGNDNPTTPDRLSAGERQLLAIAILWGLGKASGRPLPTVIDTPLGRLDSVHRGHLVKRYFPQASHQVLLLSTDEEITGPYYDALSQSVGRTYHLRFDEQQNRTVIEPGYLGKEQDNVH
ncbi:DNA sulfur modification protein DndD [Pseudoxanthomonas sp. X-1]|uniref:DNA sulfur modification protein DndD n=1 Tax=Pseudoxanthomonas sp. X-1 TaxID=2571115 RepID=UPI00110AC45E|nr:DNA sulfur modification protein DndD [Pseudoxanthomonas sp. X-1]TMN24168.1 DNA sulfur modification protein DndD [Pseudoxanthomonas sp. X-1]UAY75133.1 DNA sulfur modification protein DndD [Pseudoxanthomonas sp. X-1]